MDSSWVIVQKEPYAQEAQGYRPQVIVGPVRPISSKNLIVGSKPLMEIHRKVEVRVLTRDFDQGGEFGFTLDGDGTRSKLLDNIRSIIENNHSDPDGTGAFSFITVQDPGQDSDAVTGQSIPLYRTALQVEVCWFERAT